MAQRIDTPNESNVQGFPRALLYQPASARLDYFKNYTVAHPALSAADKAVWNALREPAGASLIFVCGPTGVGKTTLLSHLEKRLIEQALPRLERDQGHLPVVRVDVVAPATRQFKWADYYRRALMAMDEPLIDYKIDPHKQLPTFNAQRKRYVPPQSGVDVAELRLAFEQTLKYRQPAAVLIDEAEHLAKMAQGSKLLDQLDHLKSLAIMTKTVHVLVGTYDLLVFRNLSAQLSRRSIDVHFSRYQVQNKEDVRAFKSVLWAFQRHLPLEVEPDLTKLWKYCYERTIGCVGTLKDWLTRSLAEALETGEQTLSSALLEHHALSVEQCDTMTTEAMEGEAKLVSDEEAAYRLRLRLGLESCHGGSSGNGQQQNEATRRSGAPPQKRVSRVGQRTPTRDAVKGEAGSHA
jgi:energy-coupling factor transporter ATP-binding protein EcfA2